MRLLFLVLLALTAALGVVGFAGPRSPLRSTFQQKYHIPSALHSSPVDYIQAEGSGSPCRIKVIGVGGGGGNAVNRMME
eukprot:gene9973-12228_t